MCAFNNTTPIYLQLMDTVKKQIFSGTLSPGEKLPSVRDLGITHGVNPNTAQKALSQLEAEGLIFTNRTSGRTVTGDTDLIKDLRTEFVKGEIITFLNKMSAIGYDDDEILTVIKSIQKER